MHDQPDDLHLFMYNLRSSSTPFTHSRYKGTNDRWTRQRGLWARLDDSHLMLSIMAAFDRLSQAEDVRVSTNVLLARAVHEHISGLLFCPPC